MHPSTTIKEKFHVKSLFNQSSFNTSLHWPYVKNKACCKNKPAIRKLDN